MAVQSKCICDFCGAWETHNEAGYPAHWRHIEVVVRSEFPPKAQTAAGHACGKCAVTVRDDINTAAKAAFDGLKGELAQ